MVGRTHGQQALPLTFGYKCAVWVDELNRHLERQSEAEPRILSGNITGAVGTMAAFGGQGQETQREALQYLGLTVPNICWHSSRDRICELANLLTQVAASLGKIAREVYALQQVEFGEVAEPHHHGKKKRRHRWASAQCWCRTCDQSAGIVSRRGGALCIHRSPRVS